MRIFITGATGATGRELAKILVERGHSLSLVVRSKEKLPSVVRDSRMVAIRTASILDLSESEIRDSLAGCEAVISCLGHSLSLRGIYGKPRRLVTEATQKITNAFVEQNRNKPCKFILMSSSGVRNRMTDEHVSPMEKIVVRLIRTLVPPHADNETAAAYLQHEVSSQRFPVEWVAVRPDSLIDMDFVSDYTLHASPTRSAIFDPGKTSRINVADFMANLVEEKPLWDQWKSKMPAIYNL